MTERQHTLGHLDCPACDEVKRAIMYGDSLAASLFPEAAHFWLRGRKQISETTRKHNKDYIHSLSTFFGQMRLKDIHLGHVVIYQRSRQEGIRLSKRHRAGRRAPGREPSDGASRINHEMSCLGQMMTQAGLWEEIKRFYEPLPLPKSIGFAMSDEEADHLFAVARSRPRWLVAYYCALLSVNTTADPGEIRHLRLRDVEFNGPHGSFMHIDEGTKNGFRKRPVPLNADARAAIEWLLERAAKLGATSPEHFLLPHRAPLRGQPADPTRPMDSWKRAHFAIRKEAAKKFPRLARLRLKDYRHTAATNLLENPAVGYATIEHMLGHRLNSQTKRIYDHVRNAALRVAADVLNRNRHQQNDQLELAPPRRSPARAGAPRSVAQASGD